MIDLHVHTSCSDGALAPREVVRLAVRRGVRALAVTDHDTLAGNDEAVASGREAGLPVLAGVEISTHWQGLTFHLLGYGMDRITPAVRETFRFLDESRRHRNPRMIQRLRELGIDIALDDVLREAGGSVVGRPHFARALVRRGAVASVQEAFDRYLARGAPAYIHKERLEPSAACAVIREAGGLPVLAHPGLVEQERPGCLPELLAALLPLGLEGIEVYYSCHRPGQERRYRGLARRHGLLETGGSDFHRPGEGGPELGRGLGGLRVPYACYEALVQRLGRGEPLRACPRGGTSPSG